MLFWGGILSKQKNWYALYVKPHKERSVYRSLLDQSVETFFPSIKVKPTDPRTAKVRPYFPGYIFVHVDLEETEINTFKWMPGVHRMISFGDTPAIVPAHFVDELRKHLAMIEEAGGLQPKQAFETGDTIKITGGLFEGYEAIFDVYLPGKERVQLLLMFLGSQPKRIKLDVDQVEKKLDDPKL